MINKIELKNFSVFKENDINFKKLNIITGRGSSGKTHLVNILHSIVFNYQTWEPIEDVINNIFNCKPSELIRSEEDSSTVSVYTGKESKTLYISKYSIAINHDENSFMSIGNIIEFFKTVSFTSNKPLSDTEKQNILFSSAINLKPGHKCLIWDTSCIFPDNLDIATDLIQSLLKKDHQVFLITNDYLFLKKLESIKEDSHYINLYKKDEDIAVEYGETYSDLKHSFIEKLYEEAVDNQLSQLVKKYHK